MFQHQKAMHLCLASFKSLRNVWHSISYVRFSSFGGLGSAEARGFMAADLAHISRIHRQRALLLHVTLDELARF